MRIDLTERQTMRLLERWGAWRGAERVANAAVSVAEQMRAVYQAEVEAAVDLPAGATAHVDFKARVLTVEPAPDHQPQQPGDEHGADEGEREHDFPHGPDPTTPAGP